MNKSGKDVKMLLIDIPWDCLYGRQIRRGIGKYGRPDRPWLFTNFQDYRHSNWSRRVKPVGMISMRRPKEYEADARRYDLTAVGVGVWSPGGEFSSLPYADVDPEALGKMAAEYFIERGFRHFGMAALDKSFYSRYRGEAFVEVLRRRKLPCDVFNPRKKYPPCGIPLPPLSYYSERACRWLASLPKPAAVFCINDFVGLWICELCRQIDIRVPEEVAVLGVDDDETFCDIACPHLSSIRLPGEQVGYEATNLLNDILGGGKAPKRPILLPPLGVMTRQSTDVMAIDDRYVIKAVQFIREHAHEGIRVESVMAEVRMSRRPLERRFKAALGRTPFTEIRRVQIEKVKTLLTQTDKTLEAIVPECGFDSVTRMSPAFRKATGMSPGAFRKRLHRH